MALTWVDQSGRELPNFDWQNMSKDRPGYIRDDTGQIYPVSRFITVSDRPEGAYQVFEGLGGETISLPSFKKTSGGGGGFLGRLGDIFSDPVRGMTAIGTFGSSELAREAGVDPTKALIGAGSGFLTGGAPGAILGGGGSALSDIIGQQQSAVGAGGMGALLGGLSRLRPGGIPGVQSPGIPGIQTPGINPGQQPGGFNIDLERILSGFRLPGSGVLLPGWESGAEAGQKAPGGILGSLGGLLGSIGKGAAGAIGGIRGGLGKIRGILGGGGADGGGIAAGGGTGMQDLASLAGLGLLGAGLASDGGAVDLESIFAGAGPQTTGMIQSQIDAERARRQAAEEQFLGRRTEARRTLEDILGQGSEQAMARAVQGRQEQLNRQGLLGGPSGAMNFAMAQEAAKLRREQLPYLAGFEGQTETGLQGLRGAGLEGELGLQRSGLERQFAIGDIQRQASLRQRLMESEREAARKRGFIGLGSQAIGYGLGGKPGWEAGSTVGKSLEDIMGR